MSHMAVELASQPEMWRKALNHSTDAGVRDALPASGERVAVVGCGTSLYMAQAFAALREGGGQGETDAFAASEFPADRSYDRVVAITRSGTTTEVIRLLQNLPRTQNSTVITTDSAHPAAALAIHLIDLGYADERSVVQTRFATTALALWRAAIVGDLAPAIADAETELAVELDPALLACDQFTFLGTGWTVGLANEAALKLREAAQVWTESYPAMEFRHGPISVIDKRSAVWVFGPVPAGLHGEVEATGAVLRRSSADPMAQLISAQRLAVALAERGGLDPDRPRNLARSIILTGP